ncbi:MAG: GntG family PLP-dependent aldolase [Ferruginibacter sp.]|nr:threonine aldolase [Ferruginibacter sp.]
MIIDLRSDTFTKPNAAMLQAMYHAQVGDDVFGEDPTVNELERYCAELFNMEAAIFCPSGTMTNQIAIKCHTQPGDEVICDVLSHVYIYEGGGIAFNSGAQVKAINGVRGLLVANDVEAAINMEDVHKANTALVCLENTGNRGGGSCYDFDEIVGIKKVCEVHGLKLHLDGARLFNALVATGQTALQYGNIFDSISICLSKGLGAPVGSILLGNAAFIKKARRIRKVFGGGMRQAGYIAAAGLYALHNNIDRLAIDHFHAKQLAENLLRKSFVGKMMPVETNIVIFEISGKYTAQSFCDFMKTKGILCMAMSATIVRMVTHLDVSEDMIKYVLYVIEEM